MFNGYRFSINGIPFNDSYIAKGSYSCTREKRVVGSWKDANGIDHEELAPTDRTVITFQIREHNSNEHALIIPFFQAKDNISITYYDDRSDSYKSGQFRCSNIQFAHLNLTRENIDYKTANVIFTEN